MGSLTKIQRSLIIGSILGDGYLRRLEGRKNAFLEINHSYKAQAYVDWKFEILKSLCISAPQKRATNEKRIAYRFFTQQHPDLTVLWKDFYDNGRKKIPRNFQLDPLMLAVWFMDDGSKCRDSDIYLNTQQFALRDQKYLLFLLRELKISARTNRDKKYYRIRIKKESVPLFMSIVEPYIVPSMTYKLVKS